MPGHLKIPQSAFKQFAHISRLVYCKSSNFFLPGHFEVLQSAFKQSAHISRLVYCKSSTFSYLDTLRSSKVHLNSLLIISRLLLQVFHFFSPGHLEIFHSAFKEIAHHLQVGAFQVFHSLSNLGCFSPVDLHLKEQVLRTACQICCCCFHRQKVYSTAIIYISK